MVRLVILLAGIVLAMCAAAGAGAPDPFVRISVETPEIFLGDTVILEVESTGLLDPIDFSPLEAVAELARETIGTRIAVIDQQVVEIRTRRMEIVPKRLGTAILGPFAAGDVVSNSVSVDVVAARTRDWTPTAADLRLEQHLSATTVHLQQEVLYELKLRHRHPVFDDEMVLPDFDGFRAVTLFSERRTIETSDGGWAAITWRVLLYPERSGRLEVGPARFSATIAKSRAERAEIDLATDGAALVVKPSAFADGAWWLAASSVRLRDEWSSDPTALSAGDEIERTIVVEAEGVLPEQIPDIAMGETRGLSVTPVGVERVARMGETGAGAVARFRFMVRALSPVPVFLDTVRLRWWDTARDRAADAIIPARRIDIGVPDRERLLEAVGATEPAWPAWTRLPATTAWTLAAVVALVVAGSALVIAGGRREAGPSAATGALLLEAISAARAGDPRGFHEKLARLTRAPSAAALVLPVREAFELAQARDAAPDLSGLADILEARLRDRPRDPDAASRALPML